MTGPSRELPPLLVRILGDNSDALKAMKGVVQAGKAASKSIAAVAVQQASAINASMASSLASYRKLAKAQENYGRLTSTFKNMKRSKAGPGGSDLNALVGQAEKTAKAVASTEAKVMAKAERQRDQSVIASRNALRAQSAKITKEAEADTEEAHRRMRQLDKSAAASRGEEDRAARKATQQNIQDALQNAKHDSAAIKQSMTERRKATQQSVRDAMENAKHDTASIKQTLTQRRKATQQSVRDALQNAKHDEAAIASTERTRESRARAVQNIRDHFARANRERLRQMGDEMRQNIRNDNLAIAATRRRQAAEERERNRRAAGRGGFGNGLGNRADIYMHSAAIRNIGSGIQNVLEPWAQLESHIATIKVFTGSIESARAVADDMQQFALVSPYSLNSVMEATALLMKFGQTATDATSTVKMLGDVAGGNSERLKHVALGVAQAVSLGRLQGQELRQMTEGGFNPLRIAAEHASGIGVKQNYTDDEEKAIKKKMAYFDDLMRKRKLDAKFVTAALKLTTSKGGRHAGAVIEQSKTPIGLATQIMESVSLISIEAVKLFDAELRAMLQTVLDTVTAFIKWMKANKDTVAYIAILVAKITAAMLAFHMLSWAIAASNWLLRGLWVMLSMGYAVVYGMVAAVWWLAAAFTAEGTAATVAWFATLSPIALITAAILALIGYVAVLGVTIAALGNDNGLTGVFDNILAFGQFVLGYFYNIGENLPKTFEFIAANWHVMVWDMLTTFNKACDAMSLMLYDVFAVKLPAMMTNVASFGLLSGAAIPLQGEGKGGYDTSMLNLATPNMLGFLDPFMAKDAGITVPEKPDINFDDYITAGRDEKGKTGKKHSLATRDHALAGSNEQAQRTYEYTQAMMGSSGAVTKDNAPMKQVALLEQIARNTQPDDSRGDEYADMDIN